MNQLIASSNIMKKEKRKIVITVSRSDQIDNNNNIDSSANNNHETQRFLNYYHTCQRQAVTPTFKKLELAKVMNMKER